MGGKIFIALTTAIVLLCFSRSPGRAPISLVDLRNSFTTTRCRALRNHLCTSARLECIDQAILLCGRLVHPSEITLQPHCSQADLWHERPLITSIGRANLTCYCTFPCSFGRLCLFAHEWMLPSSMRYLHCGLVSSHP